MKKLLALLLIVLMTLTAFAACKTDENGEESSKDNGASENTSDTGSNDTSNPDNGKYQNEDGDYIVGLEPKNFEQREFRILVRGGAINSTYQSYDFTTDSELYGDTLNVAVADRNDKIEKTYNVKLIISKDESIGSTITQLFENNEDLYDVIMPPIGTLITQAQEGRLYDFNTIETIDLKAPWWDQNANEAFSIKDKLFLTLGDITILNKVCTPSVTFNKDLITELGMEDPYELVRTKKWTFDKLYEMACNAMGELDGIEGYSTEDRWGLLTGHADIISLYGSANQTLCKKDSNDLPFITLTEETSVNIMQYMLGKLSEKNTWAIFAQDFPSTPDIWVNSFAAFTEGRVLFRISVFSAMTKMRASEVIFGIIPMPLWNEDQDDYVSYCGTGEVVAAAIPVTCGDPDFAGYMLEVLSCEAKNYITPAYMEANIKSKDTRDDESLEMIKIIFGNIVYDVGEVYNFGKSNSNGLKTFLQNLVRDGKTEIISSYEAIKNTVESDINNVIINYNNY